ncbi:SAVED domain-containing protein [Bradyrhizobium sp. 188]|uniref:SAVED domain-containing protein n=1 Tax=Bradyrhizobium sp. 188 TaxID=2782656 RepID=UPI001FF978B8
MASGQAPRSQAEHMTAPSSLVQPEKDLAARAVPHMSQSPILTPVTPDVRRYCESALPDVGKILILKSGSGSGAQSVVCGRHAFELADAATNAIRTDKANGAGLTHMFVAAPNAFTFFLGQRPTALGAVRLYEFDFDGGRGRSYTAALTLPLDRANA